VWPGGRNEGRDGNEVRSQVEYGLGLWCRDADQCSVDYRGRDLELGGLCSGGDVMWYKKFGIVLQGEAVALRKVANAAKKFTTNFEGGKGGKIIWEMPLKRLEEAIKELDKLGVSQ